MSPMTSSTWVQIHVMIFFEASLSVDNNFSKCMGQVQAALQRSHDQAIGKSTGFKSRNDAYH